MRPLTHLRWSDVASEREWIVNGSLRRQIASKLAVESTIYLCDQSDPAVATLQEMFGATLYVRRAQTEQFDFALVYGDQRKVPYAEWSDGQQACFYLLTLVLLSKPDIVLLDEIENHLHPAYITKVLGFLKVHVGQSIVTTHHPHVIFSELADKVVYLEVSLPPRMSAPPASLAYEKHMYQKIPDRKAVSLDDDSARVTHAYKLFDLQDSQLLKQAARIVNVTEIQFYSSLSEIFTQDVAQPKKGLFMDRQSSQLAARFRDFVSVSELQTVRVLDLGAGLGRVARELGKLSQWQIGAAISWVCWEPNIDRRKLLAKVLIDAGLSAEAPDSLETLPDRHFHLCVLTNVLHELTPEAFARLLCLADAKTDHSVGGIVVDELYPLLHAEKYAVPYPETTLREIFMSCGLNTSSWSAYTVASLLPIVSSRSGRIWTRRSRTNGCSQK